MAQGQQYTTALVPASAPRRRFTVRSSNRAWRAGATLLAAAVTALAPAAQPVHAQCEISPPELLEVVGTPGVSFNVVVQDCHAYVADDLGGVLVIDICASPATSVATISTVGTAVDLAVAGSILYVASGQAGVELFDISDPAMAVRLGQANTPNFARSVDVSGRFLYVADGTSRAGSGVRIYNVTIPLAPLEVPAPRPFISCAAFESVIGGLNPGDALGIDVAGDFLYVADGNSGLTIFQITHQKDVDDLGRVSPLTPQLGERETSLDCDGNDTTPPDMLLSEPATGIPNVVLPLPGPARDVVVVNQTAYVAGGGVGLIVVDVTDPLNPAITDIVPTSGDARRISIFAGNAYVADGAGGLQVIDVAGIGFDSEAVDIGDVALGVATSEDRAYVTGVDHGMRVVQTVNLDIAGAEIVATLDTGATPTAVAVEGNFAYVADGRTPDGGLKIIDISNPAVPVLVGTATTPERATDVVVDANFAYVVDFEAINSSAGGLRTFDVSDPTAPAQIGGMGSPGQAQGVAVDGEFAYVADGFVGLEVADVSNGGFRKALSLLELEDFSAGIAVRGSFAYLANGFLGLRIIRVGDPNTPAEVGRLDTPGFASRVVLSGSLAFVADGEGGVQIVNVSDPSAPTVIGTVPALGLVGDIALSGVLLFIADGEAGVQIVDVSNPELPVVLRTIDTPGEATGIAVNGDNAFVADGPGGFHVITLCGPPAATIQIVTPPPASVPSGLPFDVEWSLSNFAGLITENQVILDPGGPLEVASPEQLGQNGLFSFTFTAPVVTAPTTVDLIARALEDGVEVLGPVQTLTITPPEPIVVFVTPPPASVASGTPFTVEWDLAFFEGAITGNQVFLDRGGALEIVSPEQPGTNGTHTFTFTAPTVTVETDVDVVARAFDDAVEVLSVPVTVTLTPPPPPAVTFVTPPPGSVVTGEPFTVEWELSNFDGLIAGNQAILDPGGPLEIVSTEQPGTNGVHSFTFTSPIVTTTTSLDVVARAFDDGVEVLSAPETVTLTPLPGITWVTPPPPTAPGGAAIPLTWNLANFTGAITENQVHFGISSVLGSSPVQPPANGNHSHMFTAPNVGTFDGPTTYRYAARALENGVQLLSPILSTVVSPGANPPTVQWLIEPPPSAPSGGSFVVSWELEGYVSPATFNAVGWGITSLIATTANQPGGNAVYSATVTVPVVSTTGTLFYTAFAFNQFEFAFAPITPVEITLP